MGISLSVSSPPSWGAHFPFPLKTVSPPGAVNTKDTKGERSCLASGGVAEQSHFSRPQGSRAKQNGLELSSKRGANLQPWGQGHLSPELPYSPAVPQLCCSTAKLYHNAAVPQPSCFIIKLGCFIIYTELSFSPLTSPQFWDSCWH